MAKRYQQLIRARKWTLDNLRRDLIELEKLREDLIGRKHKLEQQLVEEQMLAERQNMLADYGQFAKAAEVRRNGYLKSLDELAQRIGAKHDEVTVAFQEMKTIEVAAERAAERARQERNKREQAELDDIAALRYLRHSSA